MSQSEEETQPSEDEIARVCEWWFAKRDRMARMFGVDPKTIPGGAVWLLDIDYSPSDEDIVWARQLAEELGLK